MQQTIVRLLHALELGDDNVTVFFKPDRSLRATPSKKQLAVLQWGIFPGGDLS